MVPIQFQSSVLASVVFWVLAVFSTFSQDSDFLAGVFNHLWYLSIGKVFLAFMQPWKILLPLLMRMKSGLVFNTSFAVILKMRTMLICYCGKCTKKLKLLQSFKFKIKIFHSSLFSDWSLAFVKDTFQTFHRTTYGIFQNSQRKFAQCTNAIMIT